MYVCKVIKMHKKYKQTTNRETLLQYGKLSHNTIKWKKYGFVIAEIKVLKFAYMYKKLM